MSRMTKVFGVTLAGVFLMTMLVGCSEQAYDILRISRVEKEFSFASRVQQNVTVLRPMDLLWIVDNSGSMKDDQERLAAEFGSFSARYLTGGRDIQTAVITTDVYRAGSAGSTYGPDSGALYARLLPGYADGPRPPVLQGVRSGEPIIRTLAPAGTSQEQWLKHIQDVFMINVKVGVSGSGSERGMQSVDKFLTDNEERPQCRAETVMDSSCFFRKNAIRALLFVSDENDNSAFPGSPSITASSQGSTADAFLQYNVNYGKNRFDSFFKELDGKADPNYFVVAVAHGNLSSTSCTDGACHSGKTYAALVDAVKSHKQNPFAKHSALFNIQADAFSAILDAIGATINLSIETSNTMSVFTIDAIPMANSVQVKIVDAAGSLIAEIPRTDIVVNKTEIAIRNLDGYPADSKVLISYVPQVEN